jgi:hypothetical protein
MVSGKYCSKTSCALAGIVKNIIVKHSLTELLLSITAEDASNNKTLRSSVQAQQ